MVRTPVLLLALLVAPVVCAGEPPRVLHPADVGRFWRPANPLQPTYPRLALTTSLEGCFIAEYTIDGTGQVRDAVISHRDARIRRTGWMGMKRGEILRLERDAIAAQEQAILDALATMKYAPVDEAVAPGAVRTRTAPIVVSMLTVSAPDDSAAVARDRAAHEARRAAIHARCQPHSTAP